MNRARDSHQSPVSLASTFDNAPVVSEVKDSLQRLSQPSHGVSERGQPIISRTEHNVTSVLEQQREQSLSQAEPEPGRPELPSYLPPAETRALLFKASYLPSTAFDNRSISQPTSFLRGTLHGTTENACPPDNQRSVRAEQSNSVPSAQETAPIEQINKPSSAANSSIVNDGPIPQVGGTEIQRMSIKSLLLQNLRPRRFGEQCLFLWV